MYTYQVFFHVGYPKAASTSLQRNLFLNHPDINYLSPQIWYNFYDNLKFLDSVLDRNNLKNNPKDILENQIKTYFKLNQKNVFSDERMIDQFSDEQLDNTSKANRIKLCIPNAKIIIMIRNQIDLIRSWYDFLFPDTSLDKWLTKLFNNQQQGYRFLECLNFYETVSFYHYLFGKENVKILLFEELKYEPNLFCRKLSDFMEISKKDTINALIKNKEIYRNYQHNYYHYRRVRAKLLPHFQVSKYIPFPIYRITKESIQKMIETSNPKLSPSYVKNKNNLQKINDYYASSNLKLQQLLDCDINKYNYPL